MQNKYQRELEVLTPVIKLLARICIEQRNKLKSNDKLTKKDGSPVTILDMTGQVLINHAIMSAFPNDKIVGEESLTGFKPSDISHITNSIVQIISSYYDSWSTEKIVDLLALGQENSTRNGRYWAVDPIDGTKGFISNGQYVNAVGLIEDGEVVFGIMTCPELNENTSNIPEEHGSIMYASKAGGTWMSGLQNENWRKLELDSSADFSTWKFCESSHTGIFNRLKLQDIASRSSIPYKPVRLDSQVKYAMVARGDVQLYLRPPRHSRSGELIWDHAAGDIIVREAGGVVCDFDGKPLDYCQGRYVAGNQGIVAFDGKYYNRIMAAILNK